MLPKRTGSALKVLAFGIAISCAAAAQAGEPSKPAAQPADGAGADKAGGDTGGADDKDAAAADGKAPGADKTETGSSADAKDAEKAGGDTEADKADGDADAAKADGDAADQDANADDEDEEEEDEEEEDQGEDEPSEEEKREAAKRELLEDAAPRPTPLTDLAVPDPPSWKRRLEIGGDMAVVLRPMSNGVTAAGVRYRPALGWGLHLNWPVLPWLRVRPYFIDVHHGLDIPQGALSTSEPTSISPDAQLSAGSAETFTFGAKVAPTLDITDRFRVWISAGFGWGRFEYQEMTATEPNGNTFRIRERAATQLEIPVGLGLAFDVWPRWLALEYEASVVPYISQSGTAYETAQAVDAEGALRDVGPFSAVELSVVQTLGLSLIL